MTKKPSLLKINQVELAIKFKTSKGYIHQIVTGKRTPTKGKGLKIKKCIDELLSEENNNS